MPVKCQKPFKLPAFFLVVLFILSHNTMAQKDESLNEQIILTKIRNGKEVFVKSKRKIHIWTTNGLKYKGHLTDASNDSIKVDDVQIALIDISKIRVGNRATKVIGGIFSGVGLVFVGTGTILLIKAATGTGCGVIGAAIAGVYSIGVGMVGIIIGVPVMLIGKKYNCQKKWKISTAQFSD